MVLVLPLALIAGLACLLLLAGPHPYLAPLVLPGLALLVALYRQPTLGLLALLALVPFEGLFSAADASAGGGAGGGGGLTLNKLLGLTLIAIAGLQLLLRRLPAQRLRSNLWPPLLAFLAWYLLSLAFSSHLGLSLQHLRQLTGGLTLFVLAVLLGRDLDLSTLARVLVLSVASTCALALLSGDAPPDSRASGLLADPNYFALLISVAFPLALLLALRAPRPARRLFWLALLALLLATLVRTGSRSGLLVALLTALMSAWHYRARLKHLPGRHLGWLILALAIALPLAPRLLPDSLVQRLEALTSLRSGVNAHADPSLARRSAYLLVGGQVLAEHPLLGSGPGTFPLEFARTGYAIAFADRPHPNDLYREAHNTYLGMFSETGLPGGLLFAGLVTLALRNCLVARRHWLERGDPGRAALAAHFGLSCLALACFLFFLSVPSHKYLWVMLGITSLLRLQADDDAAGGRP
ncbi:O-antigen polymerase, Wzy protein [Azotobacter vinelandii CA]|uniref:O-antigen polymerase, Wzy protein n=2 Tax=Azotobacter vinelandii TaxID=354 RepID=C1DKC5_AZOVD|nr:O-antigen ligase family protein [Azotobacter vinelandii]ACO76788.1 O-antigen polymerase, Wzy protein [Azotobacter vinelandii DJ]AGK17259.1 O-antigen polymerase, Wzy protein [Azotobacter vinelandii CA]AGK19370.1 O-antigen polymerase, Wzy protein [Azotobacter vinelandii CA6]WKN22548.1 O-antigen ligase family protein [Azotobacter vinelandii]SFX67771.1 O-antigen ligase [Azotobacter vinelandii]